MGRGGSAGARAGGLGQRLVVSGLRVSGFPRIVRVRVLTAPALSPTGGGTCPPAVRTAGSWVGRSGSGGPGLPRGHPAPLVLSHPPVPAAWDHSCRARPPPAQPLPVGQGLRRRRVPPAVAPVAEGGVQGPGEPVVGLRVRDAEHPPPLQESPPRWLLVGPPRPNNDPEDPFVLLSGNPALRGHYPVSPVPPEEHSIEGPVPQPPGGSRGSPAQPPVHLHHQEEGLAPQGVWDRVPVPGLIRPGPLCPPCRLRLRLLRLWRQRHARPCAPPGHRPSAPAPPPALLPRQPGRAGLRCADGGLAGRGVGGVGWGPGPPRRGQCCGGGRGSGGGGGRGAPASAGYRGGCSATAGRPAPRSSRCTLPFPYCPHAPPCLSPAAYVALAPLAPGPPPGR